MSGGIAKVEEILRLEFGREGFNATDNPLHFILAEAQAVIDRGVPADIGIMLPAARKLVVKIEAEF